MTLGPLPDHVARALRGETPEPPNALCAADSRAHSPPGGCEIDHQTPLAQAELDSALRLDGRAAIEVAEAAHGAPGWPPLLQLLVGGGRREVPLDEALADRERGWPLDGYMYPVPRARLESSLRRYRAGYSPWNGSRDAEWVDKVELVGDALRGDAEPLRRVAIELASADRKAVAS